MTEIDAATGFTYVVDEREISAWLGYEVPDPIRVFSLEGLGLDQQRFLKELGPTFANLPWDEYDLKRDQVKLLTRCFPEEAERLQRFHVDYHYGRASLTEVSDLLGRLTKEQRAEFDAIEPYRRRCIAKFEVRLSGSQWLVRRVPQAPFSQEDAGNDFRALKRIFADAPERTTSHPLLHDLIRKLAGLVRSLNPAATGLDMTLHQVSIVADWDTFGDNSPEGIHQDGADYIVSALVVAREGITGGESVIYGPDRATEYVRVELRPGQGIFQEDKGSTLWHYVTPVKVAGQGPNAEGHRDIFGFDIDIVA